MGVVLWMALLKAQGLRGGAAVIAAPIQRCNFVLCREGVKIDTFELYWSKYIIDELRHTLYSPRARPCTRVYMGWPAKYASICASLMGLPEED